MSIKLQIEQDKINQATVVFLNNGGTVKKLASYGLKTGSIDLIEKGKRTNTRKGILAAQFRKTLKDSRIAYLYSKKEGGFRCLNKELKNLEGVKFVRTFKSVEEVNGFDFGNLIRNQQII